MLNTFVDHDSIMTLLYDTYRDSDDKKRL